MIRLKTKVSLVFIVFFLLCIWRTFKSFSPDSNNNFQSIKNNPSGNFKKDYIEQSLIDEYPIENQECKCECGFYVDLSQLKNKFIKNKVMESNVERDMISTTERGLRINMDASAENQIESGVIPTLKKELGSRKKKKEKNTLIKIPSYDLIYNSNNKEENSQLDKIDNVIMSRLTHLVIVPGHAIWKGGKTLGENKNEWILNEYSQARDHLIYISHISSAISIANSDPNSLLIFSGGETKLLAGPISEGSSYMLLALSKQLITRELLKRTTTEEYALDSFDNLLFSLCRFREFTGRYPEKVTVVGFEFKRKRYSFAHRPALGISEDNFEYVGIDPDDLPKELLRQESHNVFGAFTDDPYSCRSDVLIEKKKKRNVFRRVPSYYASCPELYDLFNFCGTAKEYYNGPLPWRPKS